MTEAHGLDDALAEAGTMNFTADCTVDGRPARLAMDTQRVYLATVGRPMVFAPFADVTAAGTGAAREVAIGTTRVTAVFPDDAQADRFARVLSVRHDIDRPIVLAPRPGADVDVRAEQRAERERTRKSFHAYSEYVLWTSILLFVVGWLDLAAGIVGALVLIASTGVLAAVFALLVGVLGSALPLCVASLARASVYRWRLQDASAG